MKKLLLKAERDKAKAQQKVLLKAEKEKQERLLAEKEKHQLKMLELGRKMLETGQDINFICNLLDISEAELWG